jgi:hypothetical protein
MSVQHEWCTLCDSIVAIGEHEVVFQGNQRKVVVEGGKGGRAHVLLIGLAKEEALAKTKKREVVTLVVPIAPLESEQPIEQIDEDAPISNPDWVTEVLEEGQS